MEPRFHVLTLLGAIVGASILLTSFDAVAGAEEAREYYEQAKKAYDADEYDRAAKLLEKAYSEEANLIYQYNRIRALQGAERYEEALEVLKTYETPMLEAEKFDDIPDIKKQLQKKVGDETDAESGSEGDGASTGSGADGESGNVGLQALGWSLSGVGVASLGAGTLFGSALLLSDDVKEAYRNDNIQPTSEQRKELEFQQTATTVLLSVGGATLIGGGILLYTQVFAPEGDTGSLEPRLRVAPYVGGDRAGALLDVRF